MINARGLSIIGKYAAHNVTGIDSAEAIIDNFILVPLTNNQRSALVSFACSVSKYDFYRSKLRRYINEGKPLLAAKEFELWVTHGGKRRTQLVRRRAAERKLFLCPEIVSGG